MNTSPVELISLAAERLGPLCEQVTFLGGAVVALMVTDQGARPPRATKDVDITIELASRKAFNDLEERLRDRGFQNAMAGPTCRFECGILILDVMPTDPSILGFANRWYEAVIRTGTRHMLPNRIEINLIAPACFIATKLDAFDSPDRDDHGDFLLSRDFEDVITLIDGRESIVEDVVSASPDVAEFLRERFSQLVNQRYWIEGIEAHVEEGRAEIVARRILAIVDP